MTEPLFVHRMIRERFHRDDEGRPLREGRTPKDLLRDGDIEYKTCPYTGTRHLHANPMNVSALRQTSAHWDPIIHSVVQLRIAYAVKKPHPRGVDVMDIWRISQLGSAMPWFFIFRDGTAPAFAAALSKATLGMGIFAQHLLARMLVERWQPPVLDPAAMLELAEASGTLIGHTEVCSGPDKMLLRFFEAYHADATPTSSSAEDPANDKSGERPTRSTAAGGAEVNDKPGAAGGAEVNDKPGDSTAPGGAEINDDIVSFGACYTNLKLALWIYFLARRFLYADAGFTDLMSAPVEPPDFFVLEPGNLAAIPRPMRAAWLTSLATMIVPFAPDGSDAPIRAAMDELAMMMAAPVEDGLDVTVATYCRIDAAFARVLDAVESGFRKALGHREQAPKPDAASRDDLLQVSPRDAFRALAPQTYALVAVP